MGLQYVKQTVEVRRQKRDARRRDARCRLVNHADPVGRCRVLSGGTVAHAGRNGHEGTSWYGHGFVPVCNFPSTHALEDKVDFQARMGVPLYAMGLFVVQYADPLDERQTKPYAFQVLHGDILPQQ